MKLAAQCYTVRAFTQTPSDIERTLRRLRAIGYDAIQISAFGPIDPPRLKALLDGLGMTACVTHTPLDRIVGDTDAVIAEHKLLGIPYVGLGYASFSDKAELDALLGRLAPAVAAIAGAGLRFLYHNHEGEFARIDGKTRAIDYMLDAFDPASFGLIFDTFWAQTAGADPAKFLRDHAGRIPVVHLKDRRVLLGRGGDYNRFAEVYEGNMDFDGICRACEETGVEWAAVEQDECDGDPFDSLALSLQNLRAHRVFP